MVKNQYQLNREIEAFIRDKDSRNERFSAADIDFIGRYEGSGGQGCSFILHQAIFQETGYPITQKRKKSERMPTSWMHTGYRRCSGFQRFLLTSLY
jgi:hypothetical protein